MNLLLFTLAILGVFSLLTMYISKRLIAHLDLKEKHKKILRYFLYLNLIGILFYILSRYYINTPNWLYFLFSLPIGILFLLFCTTIIYDISRVMITYVPISTKRRKFFKKFLDISSLTAAAALSARSIYEAKHIELEKVEIVIDSLKKEYKIVQLSDIHIGGIIDKNFIKDIVDRVNILKPDLVVITGDLIDVEIKQAQASIDELKRLDSKYGTFFIVGNHEYFHGIERIITTIKKLNIKVLENENVYIGEDNIGFNLAGVYDVFGYRANKFTPDLHKALQSCKDSPTVLLAHQPRYIEEVTSGVELMLSGHTHGGQLYPFRFLVKIVQPYISGLHQHNENLQIYVNKGTGFWGPPMRLGASAEITEIRIIPKKMLKDKRDILSHE